VRDNACRHLAAPRVATVATDRATSLSRQIHRQMYRSATVVLPTEGVGPIINLWTREVNDSATGLPDRRRSTSRQDSGTRQSVYVVSATARSPVLEPFWESYGVCRYAHGEDLETVRSTGDAKRHSETVGKLCLLQRDLGAPDRQELWRRRIRTPAV